MGFFSGLDTEGYDRSYSDRQLVVRITSYFSPYSLHLTMVTFFVLVIAFSNAAVPIIVSRSVDVMVGEDLSTKIGMLAGAVLLFGLIVWGANWLRRRIVVRIVGNIVFALRRDSFRASVEHDLSFYDEFPSGKIVSRITSDIQDFGRTVVIITDIFAQLIQAVILGVVLIIIEWSLALLLFIFLPIIFLLAFGFRRIARNVTQTGMRAMANVNATIKESISGIAVAKNFRQEISVFDEFNQANQQSYKVNVQRGFVLSSVFPSLNIVSGIIIAIMLYTGGYSVTLSIITAGAWYLFLESVDRFFFPVLNLSAFWAQVQSGLSAAERVFALIDAESAVTQIGSLIVPPLQGQICFDKVWFQYSENESVLENFDLEIEYGETIALVGHTGAGKSSIAKLIARFYEFQKGNLLIDHHDIRALDLRLYRSQLGIVSQFPFLFSGSVAENICYACPGESTLAEIENLAYQIGEGSWIESLPHGLETQVGERGSRLSMGQRQLVSLLRVLVQKPTIFILDEASASVDPFTEWQIQQALNLILAKTTSILIAHRLSTVKAADRIIVLDQGKIVEEGSHNYLLANKGEYANLYNIYFRHQSLEYVEESHKFSGRIIER